MPSLPHVSVVIPCFNAKRYVAATLDAVLAQEGAVVHAVVVDDGSTDGSADFIAEHFPAVTLLQRPNGGVAAARNAGIAAAQTEWIAFCDADDIWLPGKLAAQFAAMAAAPACRMSYTAWYVWPSQEPLPEPALLQQLNDSATDPRWQGPSGSIYPELLLDCEVWTSTVLAHRTVFDEVGLFDLGLRVGEDYDLWLRMSRVTEIRRVPRPLALYRQHPASITRTAPTANYRRQVIERAITRWGHRGPDGREVDRRVLGRMLAKSCSDFAAAQMAAGAVSRARESIRDALRYDWQHWPAWKLLARAWLSRAA